MVGFGNEIVNPFFVTYDKAFIEKRDNSAAPALTALIRVVLSMGKDKT